MKAVILAGGLGERLRPFTDVIPKPLMPLNGVSLIERQITDLSKYGVTDIYVCTFYMADFVARFINARLHNVNIHVSEEMKPLGTAGPLTLLREQLVEPFLVLNGDILTNMNFRKFYEFGIKSKSDFCAAVRELSVPYDFGVIECDGDQIINVKEKPFSKNLILTGIYFAQPTVLDLVPDNTYFGIDQLIKCAVARDFNVTKYNFMDYWLDIGRYDQFDAANEEAKKFDEWS